MTTMIDDLGSTGVVCDIRPNQNVVLIHPQPKPVSNARA